MGKAAKRKGDALFGDASHFDKELDAMFHVGASAPLPAVKIAEAAPAPAVAAATPPAEDTVPADEELEELSGAEDWDEDQMEDYINDDTTPAPRRRQPRELLEAEDEPMEARNKRTLFVGNIPMAAVKSRSLRKQLIRHIERASPYPECTKVVSLRFRSVSFSVPTNDFARDEQEATAATRRRERARQFRERQGAGTKEKDDAAPSQPLLTGQQKRKIAFINQDVNERADAVNAYVRLGEPRLVHTALAKQHKTDTPLDTRVTGPVLAALLSKAVDNTRFAERHLRADLVTPLAPHEIIEAGLDRVRLPDGSHVGVPTNGAKDLQRTLFVGNLDFEAGEEEVRALFEKLVTDERGAPPPAAATSLRLDGKASAEGERGEWVQSVRIVRDKATQLGKGFAYVKFADVASADEVLAVHEAEEAFIAAKRPQVHGRSSHVAKPIALQEGESFRRRIKLRKRPLRISRCKNTNTLDTRPAKRAAHESPRTPTKRAKQPDRSRAQGAPTPNGSSPAPRRSAAAQASNAHYLASLDKDQRALAKKSDPERQARRVQKKQEKKAAEKATIKHGAKRDKVALPQRSVAKKMAGSRKATPIHAPK